MTLSLSELIELGDSDELFREIDRLSERRDWEGLLQLRDRCRLAVERGKQLWGVAAHAEYRLALEAPAPHAASVLNSNPGRFALGPLPEVAASSHTWVDLAPHVPEGPERATAAYERVLRGDDLSADESLAEYVRAFELPLVLQPWEPAYPVAEYLATEARFPRSPVDVLETVELATESFEEVGDPQAVEALRQLVQAWVAESNGQVSTAVVESGVAGGFNAVGVTSGTAGRITRATALALMAWSGASGGAHGRRSGMAAGRSKAWWALGAIAGVADDWPVHPDALAEDSQEVEWWTTDLAETSKGWSLSLVAVHPDEGLAFAIHATDTESLGPTVLR